MFVAYFQRLVAEADYQISVLDSGWLILPELIANSPVINDSVWMIPGTWEE